MRRILGALLLLAAGAAQAGESLEAKLADILRANQVPGAGIALVQRGQPTRFIHLGLADVAAKRPVDAQTMFRTGSIGKMFTTLAVMRLVEDGKLKLDAPLRSLAPEVAFANRWESTAPVRLVHLLEHTTGWDDIHFAEYAYDNSAEIPLAEALAYHPDSRTSRWMPGTRASYANSGPTVAGYVVQKVSGQRFEDFVAANVFRPLHMDSATYFADAAYRQHGATGYARDGKVEPYNHILYRPAGSTNVTVADMAKLMDFFLARGAVDGRQLFAPSTIERMETAQTTVGAQAGQRSGHLGMGMLHIGSRGYRFNGHGGSIEGGSSDFYYQPELGIGFITMLNVDNGTAGWKMSEVLLGELMKDIKPVAPAKNLGDNWKGVDGLYMEVNPRIKLAEMLSPLGAIRLAHTPKYLARASALGSWQDKLLPAAGGMAIEPFTGLPAVVRAVDPLAGDVVVINDAVFARASPVYVYGVIGVGAALLAMTVQSALFAPVWLLRRAFGKLAGGPTISARAWPLAAGMLLIAAIAVLPARQPPIGAFGSVSLARVLVMVLSAAYGVAALMGVVQVVRYRRAPINRVAYWFSSLHAALHGCAALYLAWYGMIGVRLWA